jgi:TolB-like protein/tetratricopeptide (TPR) repeat protein
MKRRRVFRALVGYGIAAFAVLQIIEPVMHGLHWSEDVLSYVVVALAVGFPIIVSLAWIFDVKAGRVERTEPAPGLRGTRLAAVLVGIGVLAASPGVVWYVFLHGRPMPAVLGGIGILLAAGGAIWFFFVQKPMQHSPAAGAAATTPGVALPPSIAVLPFVNLSSDQEQEYFSDGIAEEILNALVQVEGLKVVGRTSSFSFKGKHEDLRGVGEKLSVAHVLEGSVRKEAHNVRITVQLISTADGFHLWSQTFDRELTGIFAVQDEIAKAVVEALKVKLLSGVAPAPRIYPARDPEAYRLFLLGRSLALLGTDEGFSRSLASLKKAVAIERSYAPAWALLAEIHGAITRDAPRAEVEQRTREALEEAERAIALEADYEGGYAARAYVRGWLLWDWKGAREDLDRARALNSRSAAVLSNYAGLVQKLGRLKEAIVVQRTVVEINPLDADAWGDLCTFLSQDGQFRAARDACARAQEISPKASQGMLATIDLLEGHTVKALAAMEHLHGSARLSGLAMAQYQASNTHESEKALRELTAMADAPEGGMAYRIAAVHAWRGERDAAFDWLDKSYVHHDIALRLVKVDPFLRNLHGDPRWKPFLKKMNLPPN